MLLTVIADTVKRTLIAVNASPAPPRQSATIAVLFATFAGMGITAAAVPATLPAVAASARSPLEAYLPAVPALFSGLMVGVLLNAAAARWMTPRSLTAAGGMVQAVGFLGLAVAPSTGAYLVAAGVVGVGFGLVEAGGSVLAREIAGRHTARLLSALTGTVAVAAAGVPLLLALTPVGASPRLVYGVIALLNLVVATRWILGGSGTRRVAHIAGVADAADDSASIRPAQTAPGRFGPRTVLTLFPIAVALLLYVGVETVYAGWSAAIPSRALGITAEHAAIGTAIFWTLLAAGRYLAAYLLGRGVSSGTYLVISTVVAAAALTASSFTVAHAPGFALAALAVAVAALGPCYSLILGIGLARVPVVSARRATGVLVACGALGGSLIPSTALLISDDPTSQISIALTAILTILVGLIVLTTSRATRRAKDLV